MAHLMPGAVVGPYLQAVPQLADDTFIAATACVLGDVVIGAGSSVWFGAVLRGDVHHIRIGAATNIQDGAICHVTTPRGHAGHPLLVGNRVTVGHRAVIHGCTLEDECLVGMGAVVLDGAVIETGAMVAAGAVVSPGKRVPSGWLWSGVPAKPMRPLTDAEHIYLAWSAEHYQKVAAGFMAS